MPPIQKEDLANISPSLRERQEKRIAKIHDEIVIHVSNLSKCYQIYDSPRDRLKQFLVPRLWQLIGRSPKSYFREFWALKNVSFEVKKGETIGIVGRNGSGKSTLLQIICGTLTSTNGTVETQGRIAALLELGSGFNPEFTGRENVYMNGAILGLTREEVKGRFKDIVAFADIGDFIDQPIKTYSSGMVVRLAFAVAINIDPQILIVDEALSVGDELFQRKCFSRIEAIRNNGATILFVSHSGGTIVELCDRAVLMDSGELLSIGDPKNIVGNYQKLLYASSDKRSAIRKQIRQKSSQKNREESAEDMVSRRQHASNTYELFEQETFDSALEPSSTIEYESLGPIIGQPKILTMVGERVNGLVRGRKYRYHYDVVFTQPATNVRFGMLIKTTSGLALGGALSAPSMSEGVPFVASGKRISIEFLFNCYLNPGVYFMNAGVFGCCGQEETVLHRKADVVAFRVLPVTANIATEIIDFGFEAAVRFDG